MRGNPDGILARSHNQGSIPARAGGTPANAAPTVRTRGLSPRVRGNRSGTTALRFEWGSIPARAGEPLIPAGNDRASQVYPRACGGTDGSLTALTTPAGLSPRVRGNRVIDSEGIHRQRSIPARAGEPLLGYRAPIISEVYPRACGGTFKSLTPSASTRGLSPRVRGNPGVSCGRAQHYGSIPARAGEPSTSALTSRMSTVYPRACGGTGTLHQTHAGLGGLSPRVRGNQYVRNDPAGNFRSIPARAGEPGSAVCVAGDNQVYPRACGGTLRGVVLALVDQGLSPRVRGNLKATLVTGEWDRSIPARAGEPST